jgi:transcriptional regulator with XRE-family HTH domain
MDPARSLREARVAARMTQRDLARAARTPQSTIARIERGQLVPRIDTLDRLMRTAGYELKSEPRPGFGVDRTLIARQLRLTPEERLRLVTANSNNLAELLRQAGRGRPR